MKTRLRFRFFLLLLAAGCLASGAPAHSQTLEQIRQDLGVIDRQTFAPAYQAQSKPVQVLLEKTDIKARDVYRAYLEKAAAISEELIHVRTLMERHEGELNLQKLGALTQAVRSENEDFRDSFEHGEEDFHSYKLIQKAVTNLEDAWQYWRYADKYRSVYRGGLVEAAEDDEVLKVKLQAARQAIEELKSITDVRNALSKDLEYDY